MTGVKWYGEGIFLRETVRGNVLSATYVYPVRPGAFIYNRLFAWKQSFAVVPADVEDQYVSNEFPQFIVDETRLLPTYLYLYAMSPPVMDAVNRASSGSAAVSRNRLKEIDFLNFEISVPPIPAQEQVVKRWQEAQANAEFLRREADAIESDATREFLHQLGLKSPEEIKPRKCFALRSDAMDRWGVGAYQPAKATAISASCYAAVPLRTYLRGTTNGVSIKPTSTKSTRKVLKLNALQPAGLDLSAVKFVDIPDAVLDRVALCEGDLLICRSVGSFDQIAKCALVEKDAPDTIFPDIMIRVRLLDGLLPLYVRELIQSPPGRAHFQSNARTAVGMWKISAADIHGFPIPVPPMDVQERLVASILQERARATALRAQAEATRAEALAQVEAAILGRQRQAPAGYE